MWAFKQQGKYQPFRRPKRTLEQYVTPVVDACTIGYILQDTLQGKTVADLGAGTGCLGIVCLLAGAKKVNFYEIDPDAFKILEENCKVIIDKLEPTLDRNDEADGSEDEGSAEEEAEETMNNVDNQNKQVKESSFLPAIETSKYKLVNCDVLKPKEPYTEVDMVIMNPPFGTSKDEGIDLEFIKTACYMTKGSIFIVHKLARTKALGKHAGSFNRSQRILWEFFLELPRLNFDNKDFTEFVNKDSKAPDAKKKKDFSGKGRFKQKKNLEYVRCCLVEWRPKKETAK